MRRVAASSILLVAGTVGLFAASDSSGTGSGPRAPFPDNVQGITISTHIDGRDWAFEDQMLPTMRDVRGVGADWVAIHPYAAIGADGLVRFRELDSESPPPHIVRPIEVAHSLGLKILIKPHLAYWGSPFDWRGEITFEDEGQWKRFWDSYGSWIIRLAEVTRDADGFVVGTELDRTLAHEAEWRRIIREVRGRTPVPLTYAANWTAYEKVPFWDTLDAIGIQAYFPVTEDPDVRQEALKAGWAERMKQLGQFSRLHDRRILFTELGYNRSFRAALRPWESHTDGEAARAVQQRCMRSALTAIREEPTVIGAFLWKWFPRPRSVGRNFQLATPGMQAVIRDAWGPGNAAQGVTRTGS